MHAWVQLTGGISKGLAMLTLDQDYISRFRNQPMTYQQRLIYALQALGVGIYEGVIGTQVHCNALQVCWDTMRPSLPDLTMLLACVLACILVA